MRGSRIVIVGGGIGGVATAWFLGRAAGAAADVTLIEREPTLGTQSTGRNAAILRTAALDDVVERIALESAAFLRKPPAGFCDLPLVETCGLLIATAEASARGDDPWLALDERADVQRVTEDAFRSLAPHYGGPVKRAWHFGAEGRLDNAALLDGFERGARRAGVRFLLGTGVREILRDTRGVTGMRLDDGSVLEADRIVIAAGGWAGGLGREVGSQVELRPTRRHLLVTAPDERVDASWPVLWSDEDAFYCRPESGGLLLSACDLTDVDPDRLEVDLDVRERILTKCAELLPNFADAGAAHFWAGVRTLTEDGRFVVGPDEDVPGLHWVAGLGGHGMTCSAGVGRLAADLVLGRAAATKGDQALVSAFSPARFSMSSPL
jgi:glycine/D-amino acid oxidase-like deaminating enzyme